MQSGSNDLLRTPAPVWLIGGIIMVALMIGVTLAVSYEIAIGILLAPLFLIVAWSAPEVALLGVFAILFGIVPATVVPSLPVAGGQIRGEDFFLFTLFLMLLLKRAAQPAISFGGFRPFAGPLIFLLILTIISLVNALYIQDNGIKPILQEARFFYFWLLAPMAVIAIDSRARLNRFLIGVGVTALLVSIGVVLLQTTGFELFKGDELTNRALITLDKAISGVVRAVPPGTFFVALILFLVVARYLLKENGLLFTFAIVPLLAFEIISTFGRALWGGITIGLLLLGFSLGLRALAKMAIAGVIAGVAAVGFISIVKPQLLTAAYARAFSIEKEVERGSSLEYRYVENRSALGKIAENPLGIGLGGMVHRKFHMAMDDNTRRYVHNGYLYMVVKLGVIAIVFPIWLTWRFYRQSRNVLRNASSKGDHALVVSLAASLVMVIIGNMVEPEWMSVPGVAFIALLVGLLAAVTNISRAERAVEDKKAERFDARSQEGFRRVQRITEPSFATASF